MRPNGLALPVQQCRMLCELADEPVGDDQNTSMSLMDLCSLLGKTLGALQRYAKLPTDRNIYLHSHTVSVSSVINVSISIPSYSPNGTLTAMRGLWKILNSNASTFHELEAGFYELQNAIKHHGISGENQCRIIQAALDEAFPVSYINPNFVIVGSGRNRRLFHSFATDMTAHIGVVLARDKHTTAAILRAAGLPGAVNKLVNSAEQAEAAAVEMGFPVVVKPCDRDRGEGVVADLVSASDVRAAYASARAVSKEVLVEKHQAGFTHRLTVIDGEVVRVTKHVAFGVYGDGVHSVEQLVAQQAAEINQRKRSQRVNKAGPEIDAEAEGLLRQRSLDRSYVPKAGEYVRLRRRDNISVGGVRNTLKLEDVHPDNIDVAIRATRRLGLNIAGIDLITEDIGVSWLESDVTICEVNAMPQVVARDNPEMYKIILRKMYGKDSHVPSKLHVVSAASRAAFLHSCVSANPSVLISDVSGIWLRGRRISHAFLNGFLAARAVITDQAATGFISILSADEILELGSPLEKWDEIHLHFSPVSSPGATDPARKKLRQLLAPHSSQALKIEEEN